MRVYLLLLLCIGSVPLCLAQDIPTRVNVRVRECRSLETLCQWVKPGRVVLEFLPVREAVGTSRGRAVRRGGRMEIDLVPGQYRVRAYPPGKLVSPSIVHVSGVRRSFAFTSYSMSFKDVGQIGDGEEGSPCRVTGCNGELCAATDIATPCTWSPTFQCLRGQRCEETHRGTCEWRKGVSISRCIERRINSGAGGG